MRRESVLALAALAATAGFAMAAPEVEPNDSKATANLQPLTAGATITGNSTGTSTTVAGTTSADYFLVSTPAQAIAIYRNRLSLGATQANVGTIRGLTQTAAVGGTGPGVINPLSDAAHATSTGSTTTPARFNQWYTFGPAASLYYRVTGTTATTADYTASYSQDTVTPVELGSFLTGPITFTNTQLSSTVDTEVFLYNADTGASVPTAQNDDFLDGTVTQTGGSGLNSLLTRTLAPGNYYVAVSGFNTGNNEPAPPDDGFGSGGVLDFPGVLASSNTAALATNPFRIIAPDRTLDFNAARAANFEIFFGRFTVIVPEPTTLGLLGLALPALLRRRRA